jgi:hypothetical protein
MNTDRFTGLKYAPYFDNYLQHLTSDDVHLELLRSKDEFTKTISEIPESASSFRYAADKWSVVQLIQHVIDTELIFSYRALRIARDEKVLELSGFDENVYAEQASLSQMSIAAGSAFFSSVRDSTMALSTTFSSDQMRKTGIASGHEVRVDLLLLVLAGHALHHSMVLKERYLPLIQS